MEIVMEEAPVGNRQANGVAENAVKNSQGQFLALKNALGSRINQRVEGEHQAVPWMVTHAVTMINKWRRDVEGLTA